MMEGFRSIHVIQGKPTISPQLMLALANRTGLLEDIQIDSKPDRCTVTITRKGRKPHQETFGKEEATKLGLITRDQYQKQLATMVKWRALAACLRVTFPDVLLGFYTPEEIGADVVVSDDGKMEPINIPQSQPQQIDQKPQTEASDKPEILETKSVIIDVIARVSKKSGKPFWTIYDYQKVAYNTFDQKLMEFAIEQKESNTLCVFRYKDVGRFKNLIEILNVTEDVKDIEAGTAITLEDSHDAEIVEG
jgi:hypothetical protein